MKRVSLIISLIVGLVVAGITFDATATINEDLIFTFLGKNISKVMVLLNKPDLIEDRSHCDVYIYFGIKDGEVNTRIEFYVKKKTGVVYMIVKWKIVDGRELPKKPKGKIVKYIEHWLNPSWFDWKITYLV